MSRATGFRILFWNRVILPNETPIPGVTAFSPACLGVEAELPSLVVRSRGPGGAAGAQGQCTRSPARSSSPSHAGPYLPLIQNGLEELASEPKRAGPGHSQVHVGEKEREQLAAGRGVAGLGDGAPRGGAVSSHSPPPRSLQFKESLHLSALARGLGLQ